MQKYGLLHVVIFHRHFVREIAENITAYVIKLPFEIAGRMRKLNSVD